MMTSALVKQRARELGFDLCGITVAGDFEELARLPQWLDRGYGGRMTYLNRTARVRADVRRWLPSARSVVVVACLYNTDLPHHADIADPARARIARYAWGDDYHDVMGRPLAELAAWMRDTAGPDFDARWCVDDGPAQEKVYASRAGIGWIGKNTCVIHPDLGSWILLGVLVSNVDLEPDGPAVDRCGTCRLCLDACPAGAFADAYVLDARRCLAYLTIEVRGSIPVEQRTSLGAHVFGCDICQDVCPYNAVAPVAGDECWLPRAPFKDARLERLWAADDEELERAIDGTALRRAGVRGLRRNLAVAIGNAAGLLPTLLGAPGEPGSSASPEAEMGPGPVSGGNWDSLRDPMVAEHVTWARTRRPPAP
jgi:epoxyqueuosine reductase